MSKERIQISEALYDIMPSDYQDLVKSDTYGKEDRGWKDIGTSKELCGGVHVNRTGDIGLFKIVSEGGVAAGLGREQPDDAAVGHLSSRGPRSDEASFARRVLRLFDGAGEHVTANRALHTGDLGGKATTADVTVLSAESPASPLELHEMSMQDGKMLMRPKQGGFVIKAGSTHELGPGGDDNPGGWHLSVPALPESLVSVPDLSLLGQFSLGAGSPPPVDGSPHPCKLHRFTEPKPHPCPDASVFTFLLVLLVLDGVLGERVLVAEASVVDQRDYAFAVFDEVGHQEIEVEIAAHVRVGALVGYRRWASPGPRP